MFSFLHQSLRFILVNKVPEWCMGSILNVSFLVETIYVSWRKNAWRLHLVLFEACHHEKACTIQSNIHQDRRGEGCIGSSTPEFKPCFVGAEAVDAMIDHGMAVSRKEAVNLARQLQAELRLFHQVSSPNEVFQDDYSLYRFLSEDDSSRRYSIADTDSSVAAKPSLSQLMAQAYLFREGTVIEDRTHHFRKYKQCFVGCGE